MTDSIGTKTTMSETEPLWGARDQVTRLAELTSEERDIKEAPLRRDVRSLGRLLGEVLKEQVGTALFDKVEKIRQLAIEYRETENAEQNGDGSREHRLLESVASI